VLSEIFDPRLRFASPNAHSFAPPEDHLQRVGPVLAAHRGPAFLQLHAEGLGHSGVKKIIRFDLAVPGQPFDLGTLWRAQAAGDMATLAAHGRRVVRVDLPDSAPRTVGALADTLAAVARSGVHA
jgi:hypothetical protein